jgi:hypothetical protein
MIIFINQQFEQLINTQPAIMLGNQEKMKASPQYQLLMQACSAPNKDLSLLMSLIDDLKVLMQQYSGLHQLDFAVLEAHRPSPIVRNNQWLSAIGQWDVTQHSLRYSGLKPEVQQAIIVSSEKRNTTDVQAAQALWKTDKLQQQAQQSGQQLRTI